MRQIAESELRDQLLERRQRLAAVPRSMGIVELIEQVDRALDRLGSGSFGTCESCFDPIEVERLASDPTVRICLGCLTEAERRALERDLELAAEVQRAMLPTGLPLAPGWDIEHRYEPLGAVSGDFFDLVPSSDGSLLFAFGDVAGKGVAASILMSHLQAIFRSFQRRRQSAFDMLDTANRIFSQSTTGSSYATLVVGRLDGDGRLEIANAGHCPALLVQNGRVVEIGAGGPPVGLFAEAGFEMEAFDLRPRDLLFLYTDGLSESMSPSGEELGIEPLVSLLAERPGRSPAAAISASLETAEAFRQGGPATDDVTLMAIARNDFGCCVH